MSSPVYGLIVAGGTGTRLWPVSRADNPKQLLHLSGSGHSLLQDSFLRLSRAVPRANIVTVTSERYRQRVLNQLREHAPDYPESNLLGEPEGRDSAPAVLWGALLIQQMAPEALAVVIWADGLVRNEAVFDEAVGKARAVAEGDRLVAVGVKPDWPSTVLGYMKFGSAVAEGVYTVERFVEKPDLPTAQRFLEAGGYAWNPGIFVFKVKTLIEEYERYAPDMVALFRSHRHENSADAWRDPDEIREIYGKLRRDSIDYVLLEKTSALRVVPCELGWSDLGTWDELHRQADKDGDGNAVQGSVVTVSSHNCYVLGGQRLVTCVGMENTVVVDTDDALLVCNLNRVQDVKVLVDVLKSRAAAQVEAVAENVRPWGSYTVLGEGPGYKVKVLVVHPRQKLSLQMHHHRAEHWVVVHGQALLTCGDDIRGYGPNEHVHIPAGAKHRIDNPGDRTVRIVEVQFGDYLGEDDIVRFDDVYGRN